MAALVLTVVEETSGGSGEDAISGIAFFDDLCMSFMETEASTDKTGQSVCLSVSFYVMCVSLVTDLPVDDFTFLVL